MDEDDDITTRKRIDQLESSGERRFDALGRRVGDDIHQLRNDLERRDDRIERRVVEAELRTATAMLDMHGTLREVRDLVKDRLELRDRLERCERDIADLKQRG